MVNTLPEVLVDPFFFHYSTLRGRINDVLHGSHPLWRDPGNIYGCVPDGLFYRPAPTPTETTIFGMEETPVLCAYNPH